MNLRTILGSLQLPVAGIGAAICTWAVVTLAVTASTPASGEGFVQGLAMFAALVGGQFGLSLTALGLSIPPGDRYGVRFTRGQRLLFGLAVLAGLAGAVLPLVAFGWLYTTAMRGNGNLVALAWFGPLAVAVLALLSGIGWRVGGAIRARWR